MSDPTDLPTTALAAEDAVTLRLDTDALAALAADAKTIATAAPAQVSLNLERTGDFIGRYRLITELGEGGFGIVWRAEQNEPIHREVALKVIKPGMDSREIIARFEAERQALALMDHPNIAGVLDAGTTDSGAPFFAMELVKGVPITDYCDAHQLTIRQRLELFIPVCQAVQHAHQKAILHRDLKPSNILVTEIDNKPVPKVIDFGIAKALGTSPEAALQVSLLQTQAGMVIGTPQYMSPEQAGAAQDLDTRSDIYTLGVILFELLTGDTPLSRDSLHKAALDEILRLVREAEPRRPSSRIMPVTAAVRQTSAERGTEPAKLTRALRGDLDWITLKALEKERERRYGSAAAFAEDLQHHLNDEPVAAGPPSARYRFRKLVQRNRLAFAAAALIALSLIAGVAVSTWQAVRATRAETQVRQERVRQDALLWTASLGDHEAAIRVLNENRPDEALAHFDRALEYGPKNTLALAASASHGFGINAQMWRTRAISSFPGFPYGMAFSPDSKSLAVADGKIIRVVEAETGRTISESTFGVTPVPINFSYSGEAPLAFSPDNVHLAAGGSDPMTRESELRVLNASTGASVSRVTFDGEINALGFSPTGAHLVVGCGRRLKGKPSSGVFETLTGKEVSRADFGGAVQSVSFAPSGRFYAVGSDDRTLRVIDAMTGREQIRKNLSSGVTSVRFSPCGTYLAAESNERSVTVFESATGREVMKVPSARRCSFSPDGLWIAMTRQPDLTSTHDSVVIFDVSTGKELSAAKAGSRMISFSPDGRWVAVNSANKLPGRHSVDVLDPLTGNHLASLNFGGLLYFTSFSPDGRYLVVGGDEKCVRILEPGRLWGTLRQENTHISAMPSSPSWHAMLSWNGNFMLLAQRVGTARVYDLVNGQESGRIKVETPARMFGISSDGKRLAIGGDDNSIRVVDSATGEVVSQASFESSPLTVCFSPDNHTLAVGAAGRVYGIGVMSGKIIFTARNENSLSQVRSICFTPDGRKLAFCDRTKSAFIVDASNGSRLGKMDVDQVLSAVCFSPDSKILAMGGWETVRLFNVEQRKEFGRSDAVGYVTVLSFSPDSRWLAFNKHPMVCVMDVATSQLLGSVDFEANNLLGFFGARFSADGARLECFSKTGMVQTADCQWWSPSGDLASAWHSALRLQSGFRFQPNGRLSSLSQDEWKEAQAAVESFVRHSPLPGYRWQRAILSWAGRPPDARATSPWSSDTVRTVVGSLLMKAERRDVPGITDCADQAPWHPLEPLSLARLEPRPGEEKWDAATGMVRPTFLAKLTLKRLNEADEKLYGRDTLAEYAAWVSMIIHEELHLDAEARAAIEFALERTPKDKQQALLDLKAKIESKP